MGADKGAVFFVAQMVFMGDTVAQDVNQTVKNAHRPLFVKHATLASTGEAVYSVLNIAPNVRQVVVVLFVTKVILGQLVPKNAPQAV